MCAEDCGVCVCVCWGSEYMFVCRVSLRGCVNVHAYMGGSDHHGRACMNGDGTRVVHWCEHTCQPSRSRRDSPDLETETRRSARRPKKADSSRFVPINAQKHDFKPAFACSLCSSLGIQGSSVSFCLFSCTRPWQAVFQTKICIY